MMNALQACISMLMARGDIEGSEVEKIHEVANVHCTLFAQRIWFNQQKEDPDKDDSQGNTKQKSQKRKRNSTDLVDQLNHHDVLGLLENIELNPTHKFTVKKEQLRKISTTTLKRKLKELNENVS